MILYLVQSGIFSFYSKLIGTFYSAINSVRVDSLIRRIFLDNSSEGLAFRFFFKQCNIGEKVVISIGSKAMQCRGETRRFTMLYTFIITAMQVHKNRHKFILNKNKTGIGFNYRFEEKSERIWTF